MATSTLTDNGLVLLQPHPTAVYADGMCFTSSSKHFDLTHGFGLWNPVVVVPKGNSDVHCGYCGNHGTLSPWGMDSLLMCNHGLMQEVYVTVVYRVAVEYWNGIRPLLNKRSKWAHMLWYYDGNGDGFTDMRERDPCEAIRATALMMRQMAGESLISSETFLEWLDASGETPA